VILCCECDCWLAFALSESTGGYWWVAGADGPTVAAEAVAECERRQELPMFSSSSAIPQTKAKNMNPRRRHQFRLTRAQSHLTPG
jgi:hypothetical protein